MAQFYPGTTKVAQNRRNFCNPDYTLEKLREVSDEDVVKILGHRAPGEEYPSVHPPIDELDEPEDAVREMVIPIDGAKAGDRVRYIQFSDSMYFAPCHPFIRARSYLWRFRGADAGVLSGRQIIETRERDLEKYAKTLIETEYMDAGRTGIKGKTVHGHSLRLDEDGIMFDMIRRFIYDKASGTVSYVKNQIGEELDEPVNVGAPLDEATLKAKTTIYRKDGEAYRDDKDAVEVLHRVHVLRSEGGFCPE
ncbi:MAG: coenzyme-B sulfoethylthiotransferase subunit gamma [Euryarchaeota archaeon]|nr:coenzyme-B sulfoethylthiotransferase subunit gamma [Euryarchaeota archaeon]